MLTPDSQSRAKESAAGQALAANAMTLQRVHHIEHRPPYTLSTNPYTAMAVSNTLDCFCMRFFGRGSDPEGRSYFETVQQRSTLDFKLDPVVHQLKIAYAAKLPYDLVFVPLVRREPQTQESFAVDYRFVAAAITDAYPGVGIIFIGLPEEFEIGQRLAAEARAAGFLVTDSEAMNDQDGFDQLILAALGGETGVIRLKVTDYQQSAWASLERWSVNYNRSLDDRPVT